MKAAKHHYVPEWYQRRFIPPKSKDNNLWVLDLDPQPIPHPGGHHFDPNPRRRGPDGSFQVPGLYSLHLGQKVSDIIETHFFGEIDRLGGPAVAALSDFVFTKTPSPNVQDLTRYLGAQKMRTPKGLAYLKAEAKTDDQEHAIYLMQKLHLAYVTMWMEGIWEVLRCDHTPTKLIITDNPVTCFNRQLPWDKPECRHPYEPGIDLVGTQTLFPLGPTRLLVISNLQFVRNHWINGKSQRTNARMFGDTMFYLGGIHTGRQMNEGEVRAANYILKKMATKFIAAGEEEWLYPEQKVKTKVWRDLGGEFFLRPDPRRTGFAGAMYVGYKDGSSWGMDEYGRVPDESDPNRKAQHDVEWESAQRTKEYWEKRHGPLPPGSMLI